MSLKTGIYVEWNKHLSTSQSSEEVIKNATYTNQQDQILIRLKYIKPKKS